MVEQVPFCGVPGRIAYVVSHSYPYSSNGYAVRTHGIASALVQHGHSIIVINRPGRPWDLSGFLDQDLTVHNNIDGVQYLYFREPSSQSLSAIRWQDAATDVLEKNFRLFKPSMVMAASNWENALPAMNAASKLNLPFFYEVRGFWEISRISRQPNWEQTAEFRQSFDQETIIAQSAQCVFTLNRFMRDELVRRRVSAKNIELIPNAHGDLPNPVFPTTSFRNQIGLHTQYVVGYVGSFTEYEGLDDLVIACANARKTGIDISLLLIGSSNPFGIPEGSSACKASAGISRLAETLDFLPFIHLTGRIDPSLLGEYYALIDLVVIPRKALPVTELVSPIKPFEAAAHGKPMLFSSVAPLLEIANECGAATFRKSDIDDLTHQICLLLPDVVKRQAMAEKARSWITTERTFQRVVQPMVDTFRQTNELAFFVVKNESSQFKNRHDQFSRIRIATVMDEFTYHSYSPECDLFQLTPENAISELEMFKPQLLLVESAWRGKDELWNRKISHFSNELQNVITWCKNHRIPTAFWNKEDPIHFETFLKTAYHFDYVFTTDIDCISRYKAVLEHDRVFLLLFACQPIIHNPIEKYIRKDAFCFAGAYYVRYPERTKDLENYIVELPKFKPLEIFDRNFGKADINYQFPPQYNPYIVGTLSFNEIDKAYKGYCYAINLNSIKQSQTMFARRLYELIASNTLTVSNFSRGVRLIFGDLIVSSDSGTEVVQRLRLTTADAEAVGKLRLAALRKIMREHTYAHRLDYIVNKMLNRPSTIFLPSVVIVAKATNSIELDALISHWRRQQYQYLSLFIIVNQTTLTTQNPRVTLFSRESLIAKKLGHLISGNSLLFGMVADDYYGPNYVMDIALATHYSQAKIIGKVGYYELDKDGIVLRNPDSVYRSVIEFPARSAAIDTKLVADEDVLTWVDNLSQRRYLTDNGLAIDPYNYCRNVGLAADESIALRVNDVDVYTGLEMSVLQAYAESIPASENYLSQSNLPKLAVDQLLKIFGKIKSQSVEFEIRDQGWQVTSSLSTGKHDYIYANQLLTPQQLNAKNQLKVFLEVSPKVNAQPIILQLVILFLDTNNNRIDHVILHANKNHVVDIKPNVISMRLGWRVQSSGLIYIKSLWLDHLSDALVSLIPSRPSRTKYLLITNQYPSYTDIYRYSFVHTRIKAYQQQGLRVDVFRLRNNQPVSYQEFENVDVTTGSQEMLHEMLKSGRYKSVLVHLLDPDIWAVLHAHIDRLKVIVWVHGSEIQPWWRRAYNYENEQDLNKAKLASEQRMTFWHSVLRPMPANLKLVFVSRYFAEEVIEDLGFHLPQSSYTIIHNPIDTKLFSYQSKSVEQRKRVLSIRSYASRKYANDLSVAAIVRLAKESFFSKLEFRIIGDGKLFDEVLNPLRNFPNVTIERRFLLQADIAALHKDYGIFLCPTRMDAQGVSRDEAMSSGLVPVTNKVAAIPEFVDETCGILAPPEDFESMAYGISKLYESPELFDNLSQNAAQRVRRQSSDEFIIKKEISLMPT